MNAVRKQEYTGKVAMRRVSGDEGARVSPTVTPTGGLCRNTARLLSEKALLGRGLRETVETEGHARRLRGCYTTTMREEIDR